MSTVAENITDERLEELLADESIDPVHRALWLLLWEGDLRVQDLLSLEVGDVRLEERRVRTTGGSVARGEGGEISQRAAALLARLVADRTSGPLFAVGTRALTWHEAVQAAGEQGCALHAFRSGGRRTRAAGEQG